jgi:hypothetical protein
LDCQRFSCPQAQRSGPSLSLEEVLDTEERRLEETLILLERKGVGKKELLKGQLG